MAKIDVELTDSADRETQLADRAASLQAQEVELSDTSALAQLRRERSVLVERAEELRFDWCRLALAKEVVTRARRRFELERQPQVISLASANFAMITGKEWSGLGASLEEKKLYALSKRGDPTPPEILSRGAQEQAYLSLRLAYIRNHAEHAEPLPVLMDEVLVNFDTRRAKNTVRAFAQLTEDTDCPHQLLYFTCHPHMVEMLHTAIPQATIFKVVGGYIARQQDAVIAE
jgi:uncharacterized protein YhaN